MAYCLQPLSKACKIDSAVKCAVFPKPAASKHQYGTLKARSKCHQTEDDVFKSFGLNNTAVHRMFSENRVFLEIIEK